MYFYGIFYICSTALFENMSCAIELSNTRMGAYYYLIMTGEIKGELTNNEKSQIMVFNKSLLY